MSIPVRAVLLGLAFAVLVGGACSFFGSPWSTAWEWRFVWPMVAGAAGGFVFGFIAARMRRAGWVVWLLTLPGVATWTWFGIEQCKSQPIHDDCELAWVLPLGWLVPWVIGIVLLAVSGFVANRRTPAPTIGWQR